ncbi:MAG: polymer-forming cytoskeletal protein [Candidatus Acidiferrales bacterium]
MWRKPAEAKPSSQRLESSSPIPAKPQTTAPVAPLPTASAEIPPSVASNAAVAAVAPAAPASIASPAFAPPAPARGVSRISSGIRINGEISGNDDLYIDGQVEGQFRFPQSKVTVGPNGRVHANIEAREIVVEGTVNGNLKASASIQLGGSSRVQGSLTTPRIAIDDGARLRGKVEMTRANDSSQSSSLAPLPPAPPTKLSAAPQAVAKASGE